MHSTEFVDQFSMEVFAPLLGRGIYLASLFFAEDKRRYLR